MLRQPLVEERVVGASAGRATLRSSRMMLSKNSSVSWRKRLRAGCRRSPGKSNEIGIRRIQVAQIQPLIGEVGHQASATRVGQHAPHLFLEHRRAAAACPASATSSSSSSGMLLHRKNDRREASSRSLMRYAAFRARVGGIAFHAEQELGADQQGSQRPFDPGVKSARGPPVLVELNGT